MAASLNWYEAEQGVVIRKHRSDDRAAADIANGLGWTVLSHNLSSIPDFFVIFRFFGKPQHVITFVKLPGA